VGDDEVKIVDDRSLVNERGLEVDRLPSAPPEYRERGEDVDRGRAENRGRLSAKHNIFQSFGFAFAGVWYLIRTQRNVRIEIGAGVGACLLAAWLRVGREDWAILALTIGLVLVAEALNTAIEVVVDLAMPKRHPLAKIAKDVAAGMVLLAAIGAVVVGGLILAPGLWHRLVG
jgi:diacylglycerol kinase (ATP)